MAEKDLTRSTQTEAGPIGYAFCNLAEAESQNSFRVVYSLPLFHQIDLVVNEGFRKIPHGGIETAGLLFGEIGKNEIRLEAFRPIQCEHAAGPSLIFSKRDLAALQNQLQEVASDHEVAQLQVVGWFLGHTRGSMEISEAEAAHFDRFFPGLSKITVVVKPERFQPTRFGFVVRKSGGEMTRDSSPTAVILPMPGRASKSKELLVPAIPAPEAPAASIAVKQSLDTGKQSLDGTAETQRPVVFEGRPAEASVNQLMPVSALNGSLTKPEASKTQDTDRVEQAEQEDSAPVPFPEPSPAQLEHRRKLARERARLIEQAFPSPADNVPAYEASFLEQISFTLPNRADRPAPLAAPKAEYVPSAYDRFVSPDAVARTASKPENKAANSARAFTALALAALLGCVVGYVAYLQLPDPVIPIDVRPVDQTIIVSWPPDETQSAAYAAIRVNDGVPVALSALEKKTGHVALSAAKDFKVEIVARNWIRDSRGIVHFLRNSNDGGLAVTDGPPGSNSFR